MRYAQSFWGAFRMLSPPPASQPQVQPFLRLTGLPTLSAHSYLFASLINTCCHRADLIFAGSPPRSDKRSTSLSMRGTININVTDCNGSRAVGKPTCACAARVRVLVWLCGCVCGCVCVFGGDRGGGRQQRCSTAAAAAAALGDLSCSKGDAADRDGLLDPHQDNPIRNWPEHVRDYTRQHRWQRVEVFDPLQTEFVQRTARALRGRSVLVAVFRRAFINSAGSVLRRRCCASVCGPLGFVGF